MGSTGTNSTTCSATIAAFEYAARSRAGDGDLLAVVRQIQQHQQFLVAGHALEYSGVRGVQALCSAPSQRSRQ